MGVALGCAEGPVEIGSAVGDGIGVLSRHFAAGGLACICKYVYVCTYIYIWICMCVYVNLYINI